MGRARTYDTNDIISGARKIFLEQGPGAPTAAIAKQVGVSEGLLFKRFGTKEDLFLAAMGIPDFDPTRLTEKYLGKGEASENLSLIAMEIVSFFRELFPSMMMTWLQQKNKSGSGLPNQMNSPTVGVVNGIADYIEQEMQQGRLAKADPVVAARMIVATAGNYVFWEIVGNDQQMPNNSETDIKEMVDILWRGLNPASTPNNRDGER